MVRSGMEEKLLKEYQSVFLLYLFRENETVIAFVAGKKVGKEAVHFVCFLCFWVCERGKGNAEIGAFCELRVAFCVRKSNK